MPLGVPECALVPVRGRVEGALPAGPACVLLPQRRVQRVHECAWEMEEPLVLSSISFVSRFRGLKSRTPNEGCAGYQNWEGFLGSGPPGGVLHGYGEREAHIPHAHTPSDSRGDRLCTHSTFLGPQLTLTLSFPPWNWQVLSCLRSSYKSPCLALKIASPPRDGIPGTIPTPTSPGSARLRP